MLGAGRKGMILISGSSHTALATAVANRLHIPIVIANTQKFDDQELCVQIEAEVYQQTVCLFQSTSKPANDHVMEILMMADAVRLAGAKRIIAVIPYFGYSRQDRPSALLGPLSARLVMTLLQAAGIETLITVDLHSTPANTEFYLHTVDPLPLWKPLFQDMIQGVVIAPDVGGFMRAQCLAKALRMGLAMMNKYRPADRQCVVTDVIGDVQGKDCILIDDIIDTGHTVLQAAELLMAQGARSVSACITHGVFSGDCIQKIKDFGFQRFYISDTIAQADLPFQVISSSDLVAQAVRSILAHG